MLASRSCERSGATPAQTCGLRRIAACSPARGRGESARDGVADHHKIVFIDHEVTWWSHDQRAPGLTAPFNNKGEQRPLVPYAPTNRQPCFASWTLGVDDRHHRAGDDTQLPKG
jgi:hypothetical protein